jgi:hypothetical protein
VYPLVLGDAGVVTAARSRKRQEPLTAVQSSGTEPLRAGTRIRDDHAAEEDRMKKALLMLAAVRAPGGSFVAASAGAPSVERSCSP